jgi:uncharacterized protein
MKSGAKGSALVDAVLMRTEEKQRGKDPAHSMDHIRNVIANCRAIFREVTCDHELVELGAALHDLGPRLFANEASHQAAAPNAGLEILKALGVPEPRVEKIFNCIRTASWEYHIQGGTPCCVEAFVLRDADLLEAIGAQGIARVFAFAGSHGLPLTWTDIRANRLRRLAPNKDGPDPSPFVHFETKLLWVQDLLFSEVAKAEACRRRAFLLQFLEEYDRELRWHEQRDPQ